MEVRIPKEILQANSRFFKGEPFNLEADTFGWREYKSLDLRGFNLETNTKLRDLVAKYPKVKGAVGLHRDINSWIDALRSPKGVAATRARTVRGAKDLLVEYIRRMKRHHLYSREHEGVEGVMLCYYVEELEYHPPVKQRDCYIPEYISINLYYEEFGVIRKAHDNFYTKDTLGMGPHEILTKKGYLPETDALRTAYEDYCEMYGECWNAIGTQFLAVGIADDNGIDGNEKDDEDHWWRSSRETKLRLDKDGEPSRVVIDIFREKEKRGDREDRDEDPSPYFWSNVNDITYDKKTGEHTWDPEEDEHENDGEGLTVEGVLEVPIHPYVAVFDLTRHKRLRIHVGNLTKYVYDKTIRERLILPESSSKLIDTLLVEKESHFKDVIKGKSGGTVILCQGPPGTGKTLTAEIYAEALERPLFTVQCSQLGTDADTLESNLLKCLARGRRWGAIMLLDEADVYVHERGSDLQQNAIVGVFLRVLEYQSGILFLTTNRGDLVDDAILSRCTARVPYSAPTPTEQARIWKVLAEANEINLPDKRIREITKAHQNLSGRDVKNLLKLADLLAHDRGTPIDVDLISEVKRFKPTTDFFSKVHEGK